MSRHRRRLLGLGVFLAVCSALTWTVFVTLQRQVVGPTTPYAALFTDVSGLKVGDDVRMAGVRVGRVEGVALEGELARVDFRVERAQPLYGNTRASIDYQNLVGQRYVGLSLGDFADPKVLPAGTVIPVEHTEPSFDISHLLNGFEPLFALLDPEEVDNLTTAVIRSMQGDSGAITKLIADTTQLAQAYSGTDGLLEPVLKNLNSVLDSVARRGGDVESSITSAKDMFSGLAARRDEFVTSLSQISVVGQRLANVIGDVQPDLREFLQREPGFAKHFMDNKQGFAYVGFNIPLMLKGLARMSQEGAYLDIYACDITVSEFPRIDSLIDAILRNGTPGGAKQFSAKCR